MRSRVLGAAGFLLAKKTASETALNKPNRFIS